MQTLKKRGRPSKLGIAMSDAQRAAMYRARRHEAAMAVQENIKGASTKVLLDALQVQLKVVADGDRVQQAREIAAQIIKELCTRHDLQIDSTN